MIPVSIQTSPYISLKNSTCGGDVLLVNFLTEEEYHVDQKIVDVLQKCKQPQNVDTLVGQSNSQIIMDLIEKDLLLDVDTIWERTNIQNIEIEINTHCNRRCIYCPVSIEPKSERYMEMELFEEILEKALRHNRIKYITFNHYNEPTIDRHFKDRVIKLSQTGIKLILHTNGSFLDKEIISLLKKTDVLHELYINLPSVDKDVFEYMTGSSNFEKSIKNLDEAIAAGLPVYFSVLGTAREIEENLPAIKEKYEPHINRTIDAWGATDRAGFLKNKYFQNCYIEDSSTFSGCYSVLHWLHIGVNGDCYICYNDYAQKEIYANIRDGEINDIMKSEKAKNIRKYVFGIERAPEDFICRRCSEMHIK